MTVFESENCKNGEIAVISGANIENCQYFHWCTLFEAEEIFCKQKRSWKISKIEDFHFYPSKSIRNSWNELQIWSKVHSINFISELNIFNKKN